MFLAKRDLPTYLYPCWGYAVGGGEHHNLVGKTGFRLTCHVFASAVVHKQKTASFHGLVVVRTISISKISQLCQRHIVKNAIVIPGNAGKGLHAIPGHSCPLHGIMGLELSLFGLVGSA